MSKQTPSVERERILARARATRANIEQLFRDEAHWNDHVRQPDETPINTDADGVLRKLADGLDRMLSEDTGAGPIPPIGGWSNPVLSRAPRGEQ